MNKAKDKIEAQNNLMLAQQQVSNLTKLLERDDSGHTRRLGFDKDGDLVLDGDWLVDLDDGSSDTCVECAAKLLLAGDWDADSCHAFYLSIGEPDYDVECSECNKVLFVAQEEEEDE